MPARLARIAFAVVVSAGAASAQIADNPVFFDDSTLAAEGLRVVPSHAAAGNEPEAVRVLQRLLDDDAERLHTEDGVTYIPVRDRVHALLLASPALLERYRETSEPRAAAMLREGRHEEVERSLLLTRSGFEAALRVAQEHLEAARFGAAVRALAQLHAHPDRARRGASEEAARLAALAASYLDTDTAWALAERWASDAGLPAPARAPMPAAPDRAPVVVTSLEPTDVFGQVDLSQVLPKPLRSVALTPESGDAPGDDGGGRRGYSSVAWSLPSAADDTVYVNDGGTVSALDRFTLRPVWRVRTELDESVQTPNRRRRIGRLLEDACTVTVAGDRVIATTGLAAANRASRDGDGRVHAIERASGAALWSVDIADLDEDLERSSVRGPALVVGDTVVLVARKTVTTRRLVSLYMIGLDLRTGQRRWHRLIATAGSLPFSQYARVMESCVERDGVVYRIDEMGVAAGYEAHTGRPVWVRRFPVGDYFSSDPVNAWNTAAPVLDADTLIAISPSGAEVVRVSLATGEVLGLRPVEDIMAGATPRYLVRVGGFLAAVGDNSVSFGPVGAFETADFARSKNISEPGIRGRAAAVGGRLHVPYDDGEGRGVMIIDPAEPRAARTLALDEVGNALVLPGQVVMVDESEAHSYLSWERASRQLLERMRDNPGDATPAATLAELAYRSERPGSIAGAVDHAARALTTNPDEPARARLYDVVARMVAASVETDAELGAAGPPIEDDAVVGALLERLDTLARTSEETVVQRMLAGRFAEGGPRPDRALRAYQDILEREDLSRVSWRSGRVSIRADLEATRRAESIVRAQGAAVYAPYSRAAAARVQDAAQGDEDALVAIAKAYPYAGVTPSVLLRVGDQRAATDRPFAAMRAWRSGLSAASVIHDAGGQVAFPTVGELVGRIAGALADQGRHAEVGPAIDSARVTFGPGLMVLDRGAPVDVEHLLSSAGRRAASRREHPRLGTRPEIDERPQIIPGAVIEPVRRRGEGAHARALFLAAADRELRAYHVDASGSLGRAWQRPLGSSVIPLVLEDDDERVVIAWSGGADGPARVEALDQRTGEAVWSSGALPEALEAWPGPPEFGVGSRMIVPGAGDVALSQYVAALGRRVACMVERTGRVAAVDLRDGSIAWADQLEVRRVADALVTGGVLVVGGTDDARPAAGAHRADLREDRDVGPVGLIVGYDAQTGQRLQRIEGVGGRVRWLRATESGDVVAGTDRAIASVNLVEGRVNWIIADGPAQGSLDAWAYGNRVLVLGADRAVYSIDARTGRLSHDPVMTDGRVSGLDASRFHVFGDRAAIAGPRGVVVIDGRGEVRGSDALDAEGLIPAAAGEGLLVTVEPKPLRRRGQPDHELHVLTAESAKIVASAPIRVPEGVTVGAGAVSTVDGHVLIGFGDATLVVRAPAGADIGAADTDTE